MTRLPPQNHDLEAQALAAVLVDPAQWSEVAGLPPDAFHSPAARALHGIMADLHASGLPVDDHALILDRAKPTDGVSAAFLGGVLGSNATAYYAAHYAAEVRALHARRAVIVAAHRLIRHAEDGDLPPEELATLASQVGAPLDTRSRSGFTSHAQAVDDALSDMERRDIQAIPSGFPDLDGQILGFEPGALYILAARPAMGKSALGYRWAMNAAKEGHAVAVGSLEMSGKSLATRAIASEASVDLNRIRHRTLSPGEQQRCRNAAARLRSYPITFMEASDQTGLSIARDARRLHAAGQLDMLLIDYLQLIESGKNTENRVQEVSAISRGLKKLAMELQVPIIALSQLSRAVEQRAERRPILSDLRESGSVEQDADTVMFIYRDEYYNPQTDQQGVAEIIVAKQRSGPTGTVKLSYGGEYVRFGNLSRQVLGHAAD